MRQFSDLSIFALFHTLSGMSLHNFGVLMIGLRNSLSTYAVLQILLHNFRDLIIYLCNSLLVYALQGTLLHNSRH